MKKIIVTILIFMFTATVANCAGLFASEDNEYSVGLFSDTSAFSEGDSGYGLFRYSDDTFDRPGNGGGIGVDNESAPVGDGIIALVVCSALMTVVKVIAAKKVQKRKPVLQEQEQV